MPLSLPFNRTGECEGLMTKEIDPELLRALHSRILNMTNKDEDDDVPSFRGIELVLLALEKHHQNS